jgi:MFS superfamily sulfate permease-like transporter
MSLMVGSVQETFHLESPSDVREHIFLIGFLSGCINVILCALRVGFVSNFLSHAVIVSE